MLAAARALAVRELLLQRAREVGITPEREKDAEGRPETDDDALVRMVIDQEVEVPSASSDECLRFYEKNRQRFTSSPLLQASHILIAADPADQQAREKARGTASFRRLPFWLNRQHLRRWRTNIPPALQLHRVAALGNCREAVPCRSLSVRLIVLHPVKSQRHQLKAALAFTLSSSIIVSMARCCHSILWLSASRAGLKRRRSKAVSQYIAILAAEAEITGIDLLSGEEESK